MSRGSSSVAAGRRPGRWCVFLGGSVHCRTMRGDRGIQRGLEEAEAESERLGVITADEVHAEMFGIIDKGASSKSLTVPALGARRDLAVALQRIAEDNAD